MLSYIFSPTLESHAQHFKNLLKSKMKKLKKVLPFAIIGMCLLFLHTINNHKKSKKLIIDDSYIVISDNLLNSSHLFDEKSIFFLETHNSTIHSLTARQACCIESAGLYFL